MAETINKADEEKKKNRNSGVLIALFCGPFFDEGMLAPISRKKEERMCFDWDREEKCVWSKTAWIYISGRLWNKSRALAGDSSGKCFLLMGRGAAGGVWERKKRKTESDAKIR